MGYWKWLGKKIHFTRSTFFCSITIFGSLISLFAWLFGTSLISEGKIWEGVLLCLLMIPFGILVGLYGFYKDIVEPGEKDRRKG